MKDLTLDEYLKEQLKDPEFKKLYEESQPEVEIAKAVIHARIENKITQKELAEKMNTTPLCACGSTTPALIFI